MTETIDTTLGSLIRDARKAAGYSNVETFAVALGVGQRTVQRWETNQFTPSVPRLLDISRLTGKPVAHFIAALEEADATPHAGTAAGGPASVSSSTDGTAPRKDRAGRHDSSKQRQPAQTKGA